MAATRNSDRWITPGVIIAAILTIGVLVAIVAGGVTYLTAMGKDPDPMLRLVAQVATAAGSLGTLLLQLFGRVTLAKTERNTGILAGAVDQLATTPAPPPAPAPVPYVVNLDDEPVTRAAPVPPIPGPPRHLLQERTTR
jgi:hypothetical protein